MQSFLSAIAGVVVLVSLYYAYKAVTAPGGVVPMNRDVWDHLLAKSARATLNLEKIATNPEAYWRNEWVKEILFRRESEPLLIEKAKAEVWKQVKAIVNNRAGSPRERCQSLLIKVEEFETAKGEN